MENENEHLTLTITLKYITFPKNTKYINSSSFAIFTGNVTGVLNGEYFQPIIKLKGNVTGLQYGKEYKVICDNPTTHPQYGDTYPLIYMSEFVDLSNEYNQRVFLSSFLSEDLIDRLYENYNDVVSIFKNNDIEKLTSIKGIGVTRAEQIIKKYNEMEQYSDVFVALKDYGLSLNTMNLLMEHYKSPDVIKSIIITNPYELVEVSGIGFKKADEIAITNGISEKSVNRVKGALVYLLNESGGNGKTYEYGNVLLDNLYNLLEEVDESNLIKAINELKRDCKIKVFSEIKENVSIYDQKIALSKYVDLERNIAEEIERLYSATPLDCFKQIHNVDTLIKSTEDYQGFEFTDEQRNAIINTINSNITIITGLAGSGKTATANGICGLYPSQSKIGLALSGKASIRINESTGIDSYTIHKGLNYIHGKFQYNEFNQLNKDVVLIDEATMIGGELFLSLLKAIPSGSKVIIMGDIQQLPAIGSCQVFKDLLSVSKLNVIKLTKPHRQALMSGIIPNSIKIANQKPIFEHGFTGNKILGEIKDLELDIHNDYDYLDLMIVDKFMEQLEIWKDIKEVQVITPMKLRGNTSCYNLNKLIQSRLNLPTDKTKEVVIQRNKDSSNLSYTFHVGDKVINSKNKYDCLVHPQYTESEKIELSKQLDIDVSMIEDLITPVFNGSMGTILEIHDEYIVVDFYGIDTVKLYNNDLQSLLLGYAITIHKSQGSGFKSVIVALTSGSYIMNNCELLYTGLTRAEKYCILIGENKAIEKSIKTKEGSKKQTLLTKFLNSSNN